MSEPTIQEAAQKLLDMINMKGGKPMVSANVAHAMFEAAYDKNGYAAVSAFLEFCANIKPQQGSES